MEKFTVIITHYNQMNYIETSIKSVLNQKYKNIELIVADDCSKQFDEKKVEKIIKKFNKNNFEYKILSGKKNVGTVKNLNNALKKSTGDYILFFAGDDKLYDDNVISNFVKEFKDKKKNIITTQCLLYDENLDKLFNKYVDSKKALKLNKKKALDMYERMCEGCFYGSGGTAYRKEVFEKYGKFNEDYIYVEDWAYWVYVLRMGEKMYYADFNTLCHRDGGISHSEYTPETLPPHVRQYYRDILNIYKYEVIPYLNKFTTKQKYRILKQFNQTILYYAIFDQSLLEYQKLFDKVRLSDKRLKYYWKMKTVKLIFNVNLIQKIKVLLKYNRVVPITFICWVISALIINLYVNINQNLLLLLYIFIYLILYHIIYILDKFIYYLKVFIKNRRVKNV